uniref:Amphiphysin n=1 Tax=Corvus moneduloides TaxID=1196302 RepID=A0A8U7MJP2_CORMO
MADMKTGLFAKNVQKRLNRAQEKVLQKLGKADETKDEQFEEYVQNFKRQEAEGSRLQRELRGYLAAIKGMQDASKKLTESLHEVYEPDWYGREDVKMIGEKCDELWEDFHQKLVDGSLLTLDTYLGQFPDIKTRIAKRSRKLVDYDSARHHLEALQSSKRKDEGRITKAEEEFQKAQKVFEEFNTDLQEELPSLWSRRIGFYVNTFKNVSSLEAKFHKEIALLCHKLYEVMTKLGDQHADKAFTIQGLRKGPPVPPLPKLTPTKELQQENIINLFDDNFVPEINVTTPSQNEVPEAKKEESLLDLDFDPFKPEAVSTGVSHSPMSQVPLCLDIGKAFECSVLCLVEKFCISFRGVGGLLVCFLGFFPQEKVSSIPSVVIEPASNNEGEGEEHEVIMNEPKGGTTEMDAQITDTSLSETSQPVLAEDAASAMPPGFLYKVEVLHDFEAANSDELNLKRGDIVLVIPSETTADQEAGWLTGIKESEWLQYRDANSYKGLFPENFTRHLE